LTTQVYLKYIRETPAPFHEESWRYLCSYVFKNVQL